MAHRLRTLSSCALWVGVALALLAPPAPGRAASCTYYGTDFKSQDGDCTTAEVYYMCQDIDGYNNALCWDGVVTCVWDNGSTFGFSMQSTGDSGCFSY